MINKYKKKFKCPCCGYPTLDEKSNYDICIICNWEDDGQDDADADQVCGGPNGEYSLTEARNNFRLYTIMYYPERDMRITGADTEEEIIIKKELMKAYDDFSENVNSNEVRLLYNRIEVYEIRLYEIVHERIEEYTKKIKSKENKL
ncbi:hypothetical protein psyc5s11_49720 [Clostridium gelidum]|uniref:Cysteine-rich CPCC domain-containing protein n=1 Tax=Clostridium gelidum TaxID=704125 RepID=A0ABM7TCR8_9CLOT|nr:CPCC family cysteine-rich protein [Clostridium gelidum]BCZ48905.1 hypothetical protein psyc5s11_49720 [Clostridium gelidum]